MADRAYFAYGLRGIRALLYAHLPVSFAPRMRKVDLGDGSLFLRYGTSDNFVFKDLYMNRTYDLTALGQYSRVALLYADILARGLTPLIIDCGAYSGLSPRFLLRQFPKCDIIAVEPSKDNFELLQQNTAAFNQISALHAAISLEPAVRVESPNGALCGYISSSCAAGDVDKIDCVNISDLLSQKPLHAPFIVKIDIEGAERDAFGADEWFSRVPIVIVELHDWMFPWEGSSAPLLSTLARNDVDVVISGENLIIFNWALLKSTVAVRAASDDIFVGVA
jgi:FkbM family methyltransferase